MIDFVANCLVDSEDTLEVYDQASHLSGNHLDGIVFKIKNGPDQAEVLLSKKDISLLIEQLKRI